MAERSKHRGGERTSAGANIGFALELLWEQQHLSIRTSISFYSWSSGAALFLLLIDVSILTAPKSHADRCVCAVASSVRAHTRTHTERRAHFTATRKYKHAHGLRRHIKSISRALRKKSIQLLQKWGRADG